MLVGLLPPPPPPALHVVGDQIWMGGDSLREDDSL